MEKNKKISQLEYATEFNEHDVLPIVQDEQNKKLSKQTMFKGYYDSTQIDKIISDTKKDIGADTDNLGKQITELEKNKADKATTLSGYGITDAYTKEEVDNTFVKPDTNQLDNYYMKDEVYSMTEADNKFITKAVTDLVNYYAKSETYTKTEVNKLVDAIPKFAITVVETLPTKNISSTTIYLVPNDGSKDENIFTEYIYTNNDWEVLGSQKIDMENYYTKNEVNDLLSNIQLSDYYTKEEIDNLLKNLDLSNYYNKTEMDAKLEDKADIDVVQVVDSEGNKTPTKIEIEEDSFNVLGTEVTNSMEGNSTSMAPSVAVLKNILGLDNILWQSGKTYTRGSVVFYIDHLYKNKTGTNTSTAPNSDTTNWEVTSLIVSS